MPANPEIHDDSDWAWFAFAYSSMQFDKTNYRKRIDNLFSEIETYLQIVALIRRAA